MKQTSRGLSLGGVLMVSAVLSVLALGLCRLSVAHLWLAAHSNSGLEASNLANSAASAATARVMENRSYGISDPESANVILETAKGRAVVTFSPARAEVEGVPRSTNNLDGTTPVEGSLDRAVAASTVHVVATATSGSSRRTVEAVLRLPPFPWAIVAGGTLETRESVLVGSLPDGVWPPTAETELLPADLLGNSSDRRALVLGGESTIMGDVESPGEIVFDTDSVTVKGEVRSGVAPLERLPELHAQDYDPAGMGLDFETIAGPVDANSVLPLNGAVRRTESLEVSGLELSGAHLFVDGDLTVHGPVTGTGVLICTGDVEIEDVTLHGATELAVVAEGSVTLRGRNQRGSLVRGLFYAGESFSARDITLAGVLIAGRATAGVELENTSVLAQELPRTSTSGGIEPATYRVGGTRNGRTTQSVVVTGGFSNVDDPSPLGPNAQPLLLINVAPTNGGFPVTLSFTAVASPNFNFASRTLNSAEELNSLAGELQQALHDGFSSNNVSVTGLEALQDIMLNGLSGVLTGDGGAGNPVVTIGGDLSRFLPFEDRVRVTSWFER